MNPEPTVGTKWRNAFSDDHALRIVGMVDGLVVSRYVADRRAMVIDVDWWRKNAIIIPDPPKIKSGYYIVWQNGGLGATHAYPDVAWKHVDAYLDDLGVVEVIPDDHGGARLVPVDRDGNRIGEAT